MPHITCHYDFTVELSQFYKTMMEEIPQLEENYMDTKMRIEAIRKKTMAIDDVIRPGLLNDLNYTGYSLGYTLTNEYHEEIAPVESNITTARTVRALTLSP